VCGLVKELLVEGPKSPWTRRRDAPGNNIVDGRPTANELKPLLQWHHSTNFADCSGKSMLCGPVRRDWSCCQSPAVTPTSRSYTLSNHQKGISPCHDRAVWNVCELCLIAAWQIAVRVSYTAVEWTMNQPAY